MAVEIKKIGRPTKIKDPEEMAKLFQEYIKTCDNYTIPRTDFSGKNAIHVTTEINHPAPPTMVGFALFIGIAEQNLYATYDIEGTPYHEVLSCIREVIHAKQVTMLANGQIAPQLASLLLAKHGYKLPAQMVDESGLEQSIEKLDRLMDKIVIGLPENVESDGESAD